METLILLLMSIRALIHLVETWLLLVSDSHRVSAVSFVIHIRLVILPLEILCLVGVLMLVVVGLLVVSVIGVRLHSLVERLTILLPIIHILPVIGLLIIGARRLLDWLI
jgi:hypothetical protein